jgi:hypothetical protein
MNQHTVVCEAPEHIDSPQIRQNVRLKEGHRRQGIAAADCSPASFDMGPVGFTAQTYHRLF